MMQALLDVREDLTRKLLADPYGIDLYTRRAAVYHALAYSDLAAVDAYKALLLVDEVADECGECHEEALGSLQAFLSSEHAELDRDDAEATTQAWLDDRLADATLQLAQYLFECGCLKSAYEYVQRAAKNGRVTSAAVKLRASIQQKVKEHFQARDCAWSAEDVNLDNFPDQGSVRREVYPWNNHEADRYSRGALDTLNSEMQKVAPKLEVKLTELPALVSTDGRSHRSEPALVKQLGLFAREDLAPGDEILRERSLLTASSQSNEPLCDACNTVLPPLDSLSTTASANDGKGPRDNHSDVSQAPVPCPDCDDTIFCSTRCQSLAQQSYHAAVCGADVENLLKDVPPTEASHALYTLLLLRALAMAQTQNLHPLDLPEVKYIWGDFNSTPETLAEATTARATLPFSFPANILTPIHFLTQTLFPHGLNVFTAPHDLAEPWAHNTLLAKFRATASARMTPQRVTRIGSSSGAGAIAVVAGLPDAAVVHPLWCLANHSCDPNVGWTWGREAGGEVRFCVRERRVEWKRGVAVRERAAPGISAGEEVLSHYVDIDLPARERREWGVGALGGFCRCSRCLWEEGEVEGVTFDERNDEAVKEMARASLTSP